MNVKLTISEVAILNAMRTNEYNDAIEGATWSFTAIDNSGISAKKARGTISSLVKKGLVTVTQADQKNPEDEEMIAFTAAGRELFTNADGEECNWGGPRLLKVTEAPKAKKVAEATEIAVFAFTGMDLGNFPIVSKTAKITVVLTKKGELSFDTKTGAQLDAAKPKFANRIGGTK